uniref:Pleckstrin homology domain containing B2 n=1 Tax=Anser cygnoides TaxID=8845 RepID=A0A8B9DMJ9_ANSCY
MAFVKSGWLFRQSTILRRWKKNWFDLWSDGRLIFYDDQNRHDIEDKIHMRIHCINLRVGNECRDFQPPEGKQRDCLLQIVCRDGKTVNLCAESADDCLAWKIALQDARTHTGYVGSDVMYDETAISSAPPPYTAYATPSPEDAIAINQLKLLDAQLFCIGEGTEWGLYQYTLLDVLTKVYGYGQYNGAYPATGPQVFYASNGQAYAVPYQYPYQGPYGQPPANHVIIRERYRDSDGDLALSMLAGAATGMALGSLFWVF